MTRLIPLGLDGNMDEINALEDRVSGKIKAAIVRAKRDKITVSDNQKSVLTKTQVISMIACTILLVIYVT